MAPIFQGFDFARTSQNGLDSRHASDSSTYAVFDAVRVPYHNLQLDILHVLGFRGSHYKGTLLGILFVDRVHRHQDYGYDTFSSPSNYSSCYQQYVG
jgi:hypothetical protein